MTPRRPGRRFVAVAGAALLAACAGPDARRAEAPVPPPAATAAKPVPAGPVVSPNHDDWRVLLPAPFGSGLTDVKFPLKEVILFQGEGRPAAGSDDQECYSKSGAPFTFRGAEVEDYVVCFFHERMFRVEAALRLPKDVPAETFTQWCEDWLSGLADVRRDAEHCEGRDNETQFSASIAYESELSGPLITMIAADIPGRDAFEKRAQKPAPPSPP